MRSSPFWPRATQPLLQVAYRHAASPVGLLDGPEVGDTFSRGGSGPGRGASQDITVATGEPVVSNQRYA